MEKKLYESMFLVDSSVGEEGLPEEIRHITELLGRYEAQVERIEKWGERELAYPIGRIGRGIYILVFFHADAGKVSEIRRVFNLSERVVRFIILKAEDVPPARGSVYSEEGELIGTAEEGDDGAADEADSGEDEGGEDEDDGGQDEEGAMAVDDEESGQ